MGNAASSFCMKIGSGIGTAALGWILGSQFDGTKEVQSAAVVTRINVAFSWVPAIAMLVAVVCLVLFDLDKYYDKAVADLEEGKHKCDSEQ
jgi:GPH family glycoside/pentoside/hexuronide:cation symporter